MTDNVCVLLVLMVGWEGLTNDEKRERKDENEKTKTRGLRRTKTNFEREWAAS